MEKSSFRMRSKHYEFLVMSFCLTDEPASLMGIVIVFIEDILIYSNNEQDHNK